MSDQKLHTQIEAITIQINPSVTLSELLMARREAETLLMTLTTAIERATEEMVFWMNRPGE